MIIKYLNTFFLTTLLSISTISFALDVPTSTTDRKITPTEIYGPPTAPIKLMLGNGGAGSTGILQALSEDFIAQEKLDIRIAWIQNITRLTLENLKEKVIDISFTYESIPELAAIKEGWASNRTLAFNDHFLIVGPRDNPANVLATDSPEQAFNKIRQSGSFLSRNDLSGSNQRERQIWEALHLEPWKNKSTWYYTANEFPTDALIHADQQKHYALTDRGSLLAVNKKLKNTTVFVQHGAEMMNRCSAMLQDKPSDLAQAFLMYLKSSRAQTLIAEYSGRDKECKTCCPLFTSANEDRFLGPDCLKRIGLTP